MKQLSLILALLISGSIYAQKPLHFEKLYDFKYGFALVQNGDKKGFIDVNGNLVGQMDVFQYTTLVDATKFQGRSIYVNQGHSGGKDGVRKYTGETILDADFQITPFNSFYIARKSEWGKPTELQVINNHGNIIYTLNLKENINEPLFPISDDLIGIKNFQKDNYRYAVKDLKTKSQSEYIYSEFRTLSDGLIKTRRYDEEGGKLKWGFLNENGEEVIDFIYSKEPSDFSENMAVVENTNDLFGYIDKTNNIVIQPQYVEAYKFANGKALVRLYHFKIENNKKNNGYRLINSKGEILFDFGEHTINKGFGNAKFDIIESGNLIRLKYNVKFSLFNTESLVIKEMPYSTMNRFDSNLALVSFTENKELKIGYVNEEGELVFLEEKRSQF